MFVSIMKLLDLLNGLVASFRLAKREVKKENLRDELRKKDDDVTTRELTDALDLLHKRYVKRTRSKGTLDA